MKNITVEEAWAVINADRDREYAEKREAASAYIGLYFKYNNSYNHDEKWWLYGRVTSVDALGWPAGVTFEKTVRGQINIHVDASIHIASGGWKEIKATEFWREAAKLRREIAGLLSETAE